MDKYIKSFVSGLFQQIYERSQLIGRLLIYTITIYLFYQIFESIGAERDRLWYFSMAQAVILATTPLAIQVMNDIRSGGLIYFLLSPVSYCFYRSIESMGMSIVRFAVLLGWAELYLFFLTGRIPIVTDFLAFFIGVLAVYLYTLISLLIGITSFWVKDYKTLMFTNLTATFFFGGLIIPITFYPPMMQKLCFITPYPWILWFPSSLFSQGKAEMFFSWMGWGTWCLLLLGLVETLFMRMKHSLFTEGE